MRDIDEPGFEARWAAWVARGRQHDIAVRRTLRFVTIAVAIAAALVAVAFRLVRGSW